MVTKKNPDLFIYRWLRRPIWWTQRQEIFKKEIQRIIVKHTTLTHE
jgi:hypothetical protein